MTERVNAATELAREHAEIDRLTFRIADLEPGPERSGLVQELAELYLAHVEAEQRFLYPALRRFLPGGWGEVADEARRQRAVARTVHALGDLPEPEGDEYDVLVSHLVVGIRHHIEHQDAVLLPQFIDACPIDDINRLGRQLSDGVEQARDARRRSSGSEEPDEPPPARGFKALLRRFFDPSR